MCLTPDSSVKIEEEEIKVWKLLRTNMKSPFQDFQYREGDNYPTESTPEWEENRLKRGCLHVFLNKKDAEDLKKTYYNTAIIVEFTAKKEDLIAVGYWTDTKRKNAAFKKLHLSKKEYKKHVESS